MKIKASDLPILTGRETSLPDVCIHPEHGICVTRRSKHVQAPHSWKDVAWRSPEHPDPERSINVMTDRQMARLGGMIDHLMTHIADLAAKKAMGPKRIGPMRPEYRTQLYGQMLIGQWRGVIPTPPFLVATAGPICRFRLQDRMGRWAIYLDSMSGRKVIASVEVMADADRKAVRDPMTIMRHILSMYGRAIAAPREPEGAWRRDKRIVHRIMCSLLSRMEPPPASCLMGALTIPRQSLSSRGDIMLGWSDEKADRCFFNLSPRLENEIRTMLHADSEYRVMELDHWFSAGLGLPASFQVKALPERPTAMEILRHSVHDDGSPQVLVGPDPTMPSHPRTEWLVPIGEARMLGLPRIPEIVGETPTI